MTNKTILANPTLPMTAGEWRLRLVELCRDCAIAEAEDEAAYLGAAHDLLALAPDVPELEDVICDLMPRARLDALLAAGAHDAAAFALMPDSASYILSRSGAGGTLASVLLTGMDEDMTSQGESVAMALVSALAACLAAVADGVAAHCATGPGIDRSGGRAGLRCGDAAFDVEDWQVPAGTLLN